MPLSLNSPLSEWCRKMMNEMSNHRLFGEAVQSYRNYLLKSAAI